jgi:hypothetical protein
VPENLNALANRFPGLACGTDIAVAQVKIEKLTNGPIRFDPQ